MPEKMKNMENPSWQDIQKVYADAIAREKESSQEKVTIASETISDLQKRNKTKDMHLLYVVIALIVSVSVMSGFNYKNNNQWRKVVEQSDQKWIDYLSQYDFVSQDGEGYNYYNSDVGGDVNNGAESKTQKEKEYGQGDGN